MVSPLKVEFQFDFGSPNAYLAEIAIPGIEERTGVKFEYVPVLLGGNLQGHQQHIAVRVASRGQEQARISSAGNAALYSPP